MPRMEVPVIGIGAGRRPTARCSSSTTCSGSAPATARFVKRYADILAAMVDGVAAYVADVRARAFPGPEHAYSMDPEELSVFRAARWRELAG